MKQIVFTPEQVVKVKDDLTGLSFVQGMEFLFKYSYLSYRKMDLSSLFSFPSSS